MFKRILPATDGSARSEKALKYARDLALRDEAQVFIVHVFEPVPSYVSHCVLAHAHAPVMVVRASGEQMG